jgi:hypothetical protein
MSSPVPSPTDEQFDFDAGPLTAFALSLFEGGEIRIDRPPQGGAYETTDLDSANKILKAMHCAAALEAPGQSPDLEPMAAIWGLQLMHWACWLTLDRIETDTRPPEWLVAHEPDGQSANQHWSVDLSLRYLSHLTDRVAKLSNSDTLKTELLGLGSRWPLSAIGMKTEEDSTRRTVVLNDPMLRMAYIDRIVKRADATRFKADDIIEDLRHAIGAFDRLAPIHLEPLSVISTSENGI